MKKTLLKLLVIIVAIVLVPLISYRVFARIRYMPQDIQGYNYNIPLRTVLTPDAVYYSKHHIGIDVYATTTRGSDWLYNCTDFNGVYYEGYWYFEYENNIEKYDIKRKKRTVIAKLDDSVSSLGFYILENHIYASVVYINDSENTFISLSLENGESFIIAHSIYLIGVIDGAPSYITKNDNVFSVYRFDTNSKTSVFLGEVEINEPIQKIDFTSDNIIFTVYEDCKTVLKIYNFATQRVTTPIIDIDIMSIVSYDECIFILSENKDTSTVYRYHIENDELKEICIVDENAIYVDIYPTSDDVVYVILRRDYTPLKKNYGIRKYSVDGAYEDVLVNLITLLKNNQKAILS